MHDKDYKSFYDERRDETYSHDYNMSRAEDSSKYDELTKFIGEYSLGEKKCLEIGSSGGFFQDMVEDYYGTDIAETLSQYYHKPYKVSVGTKYNFESESFDAIWTFSVFEHIPHLQEALLEIKRLLKPGGVVLFNPAWQCRSWAADGYQVRPYSDFRFTGKLIKASIPIRNSIVWRSFFIFPKRIYRHIGFLLGHKYKTIIYKKIKPNYKVYWTSDSDACNQIDPHDAILWFVSNGFECLSHPLNFRAFMVRNGSIIFKKKLDENSD